MRNPSQPRVSFRKPCRPARATGLRWSLRVPRLPAGGRKEERMWVPQVDHMRGCRFLTENKQVYAIVMQSTILCEA